MGTLVDEGLRRWCEGPSLAAEIGADGAVDEDSRGLGLLPPRKERGLQDDVEINGGMGEKVVEAGDDLESVRKLGETEAPGLEVEDEDKCDILASSKLEKGGVGRYGPLGLSGTHERCSPGDGLGPNVGLFQR